MLLTKLWTLVALLAALVVAQDGQKPKPPAFHFKAKIFVSLPSLRERFGTEHDGDDSGTYQTKEYTFEDLWEGKRMAHKRPVSYTLRKANWHFRHPELPFKLVVNFADPVVIEDRTIKVEDIEKEHDWVQQQKAEWMSEEGGPPDLVVFVGAKKYEGNTKVVSVSSTKLCDEHGAIPTIVLEFKRNTDFSGLALAHGIAILMGADNLINTLDEPLLIIGQGAKHYYHGTCDAPTPIWRTCASDKPAFTVVDLRFHEPRQWTWQECTFTLMKSFKEENSQCMEDRKKIENPGTP